LAEAMSVCRYCGQKAGWFKEAHEECERKARAARDEREQKEREERDKRQTKDEVRRQVGDANIWASKRQNLVDKFPEVAERRIYIDEYGTENWDGVFEEMKRFLVRAAERDGESPATIAQIKKAFFKGGCTLTALPENYSSRYIHLSVRFHLYHKSQKARVKDSEFTEQSGTEFETYLASVLRQEGFEDVCGTAKTGDQGADLIVVKNGRKIAIQAKRYKGSVGNEAVQEVVASVKFYGADEGWVITSGTFTPSARALAQKNAVKLIDGVALKRRDFA
jgi:HJR/Mrr/RecB family endonuclease